MSHIFISYSRSDSKVVDFIVSQLRDDGFDIWIDHENLKVGDVWREKIVRAIKTAGAFVLVLSPNSIKSDDVRKELDLAELSKRRLFPLLLASVDLPDSLVYQLSGIQWIELHVNPEEKYLELVAALRTHLQSVQAMPESRQVEVVMGAKNEKEFGGKEQDKLIKLLARKVRATSDNLQLTKVTAGSVHVFINMPSDAAYSLMTTALNRDKDLINFGIDAMRLDGEEKFVLLKSGEIGPLDLRPPRAHLPRIFLMIIGAGILLAAFFAAARAFAPLINPPTSTPTSSRIPPSQTPTRTATPTNTFTLTATSTYTNTPTNTVTDTFTPSTTSSPTPTQSPAPRLVDLYYWWSAASTDNFATTNKDWIDQQPCGDLFNFDYTTKKPAIEARIFSPTAPQPANTIKLYSYYNCWEGDGFTTTIPPNKIKGISSDYIFLYLEGYIYEKMVDGTMPLNTWYSKINLDYFTSTYWSGKIGDEKPPGYILERVEGYVFPP